MATIFLSCQTLHVCPLVAQTEANCYHWILIHISPKQMKTKGSKSVIARHIYLLFFSCFLCERVSPRVTQEVRWCAWSGAGAGSWQGLWAGVRAVRGWTVPAFTRRWWSSLSGSISRLEDRCDCTPDRHKQNGRLDTHHKDFPTRVPLQSVQSVFGECVHRSGLLEASTLLQTNQLSSENPHWLCWHAPKNDIKKKNHYSTWLINILCERKGRIKNNYE